MGRAAAGRRRRVIRAIPGAGSVVMPSGVDWGEVSNDALRRGCAPSSTMARRRRSIGRETTFTPHPRRTHSSSPGRSLSCSL